MSRKADGRWVGMHGIGRYWSEVAQVVRDLGFDICLDGPVPATPQDVLHLAKNLHRGDFFYSPGFNAAISRPGIKQLITVHDLIHLDVPEEASALKRAYYRGVVRRAVRQNGGAITVSLVSQQRTAEWAGLDEAAIRVVYPGVSDEFLSSPLRAGEDYILFVGNAKPHKRAALAVELASHLPDGMHLKCVGMSKEDILRVGGPHDDRVRAHDRVSDAELVGLYANAQCLFFPSLVEGFGLPALEAMAVGVSSVYVASSIEEIVGPFGVRVGAQAPMEQLVDSIEVAISMRGNAEALRRRAETFTWDRTREGVKSAVENSL